MNLNKLLEHTMMNVASDLHLCVGVPPIIRVNGDLLYLDEPVLTPLDCENLMKQCLSNEACEKLIDKGEVDVSFFIPGRARFRINVFKQRGTYAIAIRVIPSDVPKIIELGLPERVCELAFKQRGLVLVTGPTGSGKTTTLASMIDYINERKKCHIITIEDPIEFLHKHNRSVINQREIGVDTQNYANAMRAVLREDPDVILIGEMRDQETIATALTAAETGHLVLSTLHTVGAAKTIDRIIDVFPPHQQPQVRSQLSTVLQGIISQQLIKKADGRGRVLATEFMLWTPAIANMIREGRVHQINASIHTGVQFGMFSMDSSIANLYKSKMIDYQSVTQYSIDIENINKLIAG